MYAQIDSSGYCFAVSDYNAPGAIKVSGVDVLGKIYQDGEWLNPPQEEQPTTETRDLQTMVDELSQKIDLIGQLQMQQILATEGGGGDVNQDNA